MHKIFVHTHADSVGVGVLILRLMFGTIMFAHGAQKVLGLFDGKDIGTYATGMAAGAGLPLVFGYIAVFAEFLGGLGLITGLYTRFFAGMVFFTMIFASSVHAGFFAPKGFEYPLSIAMAVLAIFFIGPGRYSLDHLLFHKSGKHYDAGSSLR